MKTEYCRDCDHCRENVFGSDKCYKHGMKFVCEIENCVYKVVNETVTVNLDELHGLEFEIRMIREGSGHLNNGRPFIEILKDGKRADLSYYRQIKEYLNKGLKYG